MSKFAIVGCEASGKTVFMSALCDCFRNAIVPENAAANRFARFANRQLRALRQWPPATPPGKAVEMNFTLRENGRILAELGLLEFGGETFRAAFRDDASEPAHKKAVGDLLAFLGDADFILVLVSLQELFRDPGETPLDDFERDTESIWVTRGLLEFIRDKAPTANVAIGLTQADRFTHELTTVGNPSALLSARWPSIRAVAPDLPVIAIASVSGTDAEGRPADGFSTDGVLPVLREFARLQYGSPADLLVSLSTSRNALAAIFANQDTAVTKLSEITRLIKRYRVSLASLEAFRTLTKDPLSKELESAANTLIEGERKLKELRALSPKCKTKHRKKVRRTGLRRVLLLTLLLASVIFFADTYRPHSIANAPSLKIHRPRLVPAVASVETNTVPLAVTNTVPLAVTNEIPSVATNAIPCAVSNAPYAAVTNEPPFRVWHDHKGKSIEARWIGTSKDQQSITLETRNGRRIRAVLYKFSEEDRAFVREKLDTSSDRPTP